MKAPWILLSVCLSLLVQIVCAPLSVGGRWAFDFVLVGVVFAALQWGAGAGILAGTVGGLAQDALAGGVIGVGGLAKTLVGVAAGAIGTQFMLVQPYTRMVIVAGATVVHRFLVLAVYALIDQRWPGVAWGAMLIEIVINALAGWLAFYVVNTLPGALERRRATRRQGLRRRQW